MKNGCFKKSVTCRIISTFLIATFSFYNVGFSAGSIKASSDGVMLSPIPRIFDANNDVFERGLRDELSTAGAAIDQLAQKWLNKKRTEWEKEFVSQEDANEAWTGILTDETPESDWNAIRTIYLGIVNKALDKGNISSDITEKVAAVFRRIKEEELTRYNRSPGTEKMSIGLPDALIDDAKNVIDEAIYNTILELKQIIASELKLQINNTKVEAEFQKRYSVFIPSIGGSFVILPEETYKKYLDGLIAHVCEQYAGDDLPAYKNAVERVREVMVHPGTKKTREQMKDGVTYERIKRNYYITDTFYNTLTPAERKVVANHEEIHIKLAVGELKADIPTGMTEEEWINGHSRWNIDPILARLGYIAYIEKEIEHNTCTFTKEIKDIIANAKNYLNRLKTRRAFFTLDTVTKTFNNALRKLYENIFIAEVTLPGTMKGVSRTDIDRMREIKGLLSEITKEERFPGSANLPEITVLSDYHGEIDLFLKYLADAISQKTGKPVILDHKTFPGVGVAKQLLEQGIDIKRIGMRFYLTGDFLDRGPYGLKCFRVAEELIDLGVAEYVTGNHDLWAMLNLTGFHLPIYEGYNFYGHTGSETLVKAHWRDAGMRTPEQKFAWWTKKLAEYNAAQTDLQKTLFGGDLDKIRARLKEEYIQFKDQFTDDEKQLWKDLVGLYSESSQKDIDVYTGFNAVGMMSQQWWEERLSKLTEIVLTKRSVALEHEISVWENLYKFTAEADKVYGKQLQQAVGNGKWWWKVFNDINHQNYTSAEWWAKDWASHKGWGTSVISELNGIEGGETWDQSNYINNPHLKDLANFYRKNFTLYQVDDYGNKYMHAWPPVDLKTGLIRFTYKDVLYEGPAIWKGFNAIQKDVRNMNKPLAELYEAYSLVNSWYADHTTKAKPKHIKQYVDLGLDKIYKANGIGRLLITAHNTLNKLHPLGVGFKTEANGVVHIAADKGMSWRKFKDLGGYTVIGPGGVKLRGYTSPDFKEVADNPDTLALKITKEEVSVKDRWPNDALQKKDFLKLMREQLTEEFEVLRSSVEKPEDAARDVTEKDIVIDGAGRIPTLEEQNYAGKRVVIRVDYNCPVKVTFDEAGNVKKTEITGVSKIERSLPTLRYILDQKPKSVTLITHFSPQKKKPGAVKSTRIDLSTKIIADELRSILPEQYGNEVIFMKGSVKKDGIAANAIDFIKNRNNGEIIMLDNIRLAKGEKENDVLLRDQLSSLADVYVVDAFGTVHREHASMMPDQNGTETVIGKLVEEELVNLIPMLSPKRPFVAMFSGLKVSDKVEEIDIFIENMVKGDVLVIGGAMAYTFLKAKDGNVPLGESVLEEESIPIAEHILETADKKGISVILPIDHVVARQLGEGEKSKEVSVIPEGWMGVDIGPRTTEEIEKALGSAVMVFWNGPFGVFEKRKGGFIAGTKKVAEKIHNLISSGQIKQAVLGGGDTVKAAKDTGVSLDGMYVSTGGGATMDFFAKRGQLDTLKNLAVPGKNTKEKRSGSSAKSINNNVPKAFEITIMGEEDVATNEDESMQGSISAQDLAEAGVTQVVVDLTKPYAETQIKNLHAQGITIVIVKNERMRDKSMFDAVFLKGVPFKFAPPDIVITPMDKVGERAILAEELAANFSGISSAAIESVPVKAERTPRIPEKDQFSVVGNDKLQEILATGSFKVQPRCAFKAINDKVSDTVDIVTLNGSKLNISELLPVIGNRVTKITIKQGAFVIQDGSGEGNNSYLAGDLSGYPIDALVLSGEDKLVVNPGAENVKINSLRMNIDGLVPERPDYLRSKTVYVNKVKRDGSTKYSIRMHESYNIERVSDEAVVLEIEYDKTPVEKIGYAVYETIRNHSKEVNETNGHLIVATEVFGTKLSSKEISKRFEGYLGKKVPISLLQSTSGINGKVETLLRGIIANGETPILVVKAQDLKDVDAGTNEELKKLLGNIRVLPLTDKIEKLRSEEEGWFPREIIATALLQSALTAKKITARSSLAKDMVKLMPQLIQSDHDFQLNDLYMLLPFTSDGIPEILRYNNFKEWIENIINGILVTMKMTRYDPSKEFKMRLQTMYSA